MKIFIRPNPIGKGSLERHRTPPPKLFDELNSLKIFTGQLGSPYFQH